MSEQQKKEETKEIKETKEIQEHSGSSSCPEQTVRPWSDAELQQFLEEWESLEIKDCLKDMQAAEAISQGLRYKGVEKSTEECFLTMKNMVDMYWYIKDANKEWVTQPLPCPFGQALQRILEPSVVDDSPGPPSADVVTPPPHSDHVYIAVCQPLYASGG